MEETWERTIKNASIFMPTLWKVFRAKKKRAFMIALASDSSQITQVIMISNGAYAGCRQHARVKLNKCYNNDDDADARFMGAQRKGRVD